MMIKKKRITAALLALGLGAVTMFSQFPVSAAEETAQNTDAAAQTADPSVVVTNGIDGWPQVPYLPIPFPDGPRLPIFRLPQQL